MTCSSSSSEQGLENFDSRVLRMTSTPKKWKWAKTHKLYRQIKLVLLMFFFGICCPLLLLGATPETRNFTTRLSFFEQINLVLLGKSISEIEALKSGVFEPYPDGRYHLDWPVSKGMGAKILYRFLLPSIRSNPLPGQFSDIQENSTFAPALSMIGGAFKPIGRNRFAPDHLLSKKETKMILETIAQHQKKATDTANDSFGAEQSRQLFSQDQFQNATSTLEKRFSTEFFLPSPIPKVSSLEDESLASYDTARLEKLRKLNNFEQWSPNIQFDLDAIENGLNELEPVLDSLELSVLDLTTCTPENENEENQLKDALITISQISAQANDKLQYSQVQLNATLLADGERIARCASLKNRLKTDISRLKLVQSKIDARLNTSSFPNDKSKEVCPK